MPANAGQREELTQGPAGPEILFNAERLETQCLIHLLEREPTPLDWKLEEIVHTAGFGWVRGRRMSAIHLGA